MRIALLIFFCWLSTSACKAQHSIQESAEAMLRASHEAGHFNGTMLLAAGDTVVAESSFGFANMPFRVPVQANTRFPIASVSKLFTAVQILQLAEAGKLELQSPISRYLPEYVEIVGNATISDVVLHKTALQNEPIATYRSRLSLDTLITRYAKDDSSRQTSTFNYNNVDYWFLSKLIERISGEDFASAIQKNLINPLKLSDTGFVDDREIIPHLANGYHNYSFGDGKPGDPLYNDSRILSNYYGAGSMYSTARDLLTFLHALRDDRIISQKMREDFLIRVQHAEFIDWLEGSPTIGFFYNDEGAFPRLYRSGNIDGFNAIIITDVDFNRVLILLANTDTADISVLGNQLFTLLP